MAPHSGDSTSIASLPNQDSTTTYRQLLVLYGSETGTAQDVAERIWRDAQRRRFRARIFAMDEYDIANLINERLIIFVCSTTGQGDEPTNMKKFWKFLLRKNLPSDILADMHYTVFGLGDSSYSRYNYAAKKLYKRLSTLGAQSIYQRGDGDDQHYLGIDGTLDPWLRSVWQILMELYPLPPDQQILADDVLLPPSFHFNFSRPNTSLIPVVANQIGEFSARIIANERITSLDHFQDVRHVELEILEEYSSSASYEPGDVLVLQPQNIPEEVTAFIEYMGWTNIADDILTITLTGENRSLPPNFPSHTTLRHLLTNHLSPFSVPRRSFFDLLSFFTTSPSETEKLREWCSPSGQDDLLAYAHRPKRTLFEALTDFKSAKIPIDYIMDLIPPLQGRMFSIASDLQTHPNQIHATIALVQYKTIMKVPRRGICSKFISKLNPGAVLHHLRISKGTMRLPRSPDIPIIMIGPGTGVAPFRAFIERRSLNKQKDNTLYFGCRFSQKDFLYAKEWHNYVGLEELVLRTAFSRDQSSKIYVQDLLASDAATLWPLISKGAHIYVCGSAGKMPEQIKYAFKKIAVEEGGLRPDEADEMIEKRVMEEVWS